VLIGIRDADARKLMACLLHQELALKAALSSVLPFARLDTNPHYR